MTSEGRMAERLALKRLYPTAHDLRRRARRVLPGFAFEYMDGGAGADTGIAGKAFLWSLRALGARGPGHLIDLLVEDIRSTLGQLGCASLDELRSVVVRHAGAFRIGNS